MNKANTLQAQSGILGIVNHEAQRVNSDEPKSPAASLVIY